MPDRLTSLLCRIGGVAGLVILWLLIFAPQASADNHRCLLCPPPTTTPPPESPPTTSPPPPPSEPPPNDPGQSPPVAGAAYDVPGGPARMLELINAERAKVGAAPLAVHERARQIAASWSREMLKDRYISHNDEYFSAKTRRELGATALGENVAMDSRVDDAHENLMNSPGHRANILDKRFNGVGIGVVTDNLGVLYITQDFLATSRIVGPSAPAPVRTVAPAPRPKPPVARVALKPRVPAVKKAAAPVPSSSPTTVPTVLFTDAPPSPYPDVATIATTPVTHQPAGGMGALPLVAGAALVAIVAALGMAPSSRRMFQELLVSGPASSPTATWTRLLHSLAQRRTHSGERGRRARRPVAVDDHSRK